MGPPNTTMLRVLLPLLLAAPIVVAPFFAGQALAQTPILQALRANDWPRARSLAAADADPLAPTLVDFIRLLNPGQANAL